MFIKFNVQFADIMSRIPVDQAKRRSFSPALSTNAANLAFRTFCNQHHLSTANIKRVLLGCVEMNSTSVIAFLGRCISLELDNKIYEDYLNLWAFCIIVIIFCHFKADIDGGMFISSALEFKLFIFVSFLKHLLFF